MSTSQAGPAERAGESGVQSVSQLWHQYTKDPIKVAAVVVVYIARRSANLRMYCLYLSSTFFCLLFSVFLFQLLRY